MANVFISYARRDIERAKLLAEAIQQLGWTVWWDRVIPTGRVFDEVIQEEIDKADCVVVLWSTASVASQWVKEEARYALGQRKFFPVRLDEVSPPLGFGGFQTADLAGDPAVVRTAGYDRLIEDMTAVLGDPPTRKVIREQSSPVSLSSVEASVEEEALLASAARGPSSVPRPTRSEGRSKASAELVSTEGDRSSRSPVLSSVDGVSSSSSGSAHSALVWLVGILMLLGVLIIGFGVFQKLSAVSQDGLRPDKGYFEELSLSTPEPSTFAISMCSTQGVGAAGR